ncbi:MAG: hypothetical protein AUH85_02500 [Chloroflexi bacterium 13_1_40CM_4_68_4]|nr:MAG: hypothetical protein AUH85_02500 [Chloroflexi bacterium 13_1_40CM_4_68_4]
MARSRSRGAPRAGRGVLMRTLLDIVDTSAERFGDKPALLIKPAFRTRIWRYRDLADVVPRVARVLAESGVNRGDRVVIWAANRPEWAIAFFGALHAGAVLVPLDVRSTQDFSDRVVERTRPVLVLASHPTLDRARALGLPLQTIESLPDLARGCPPFSKPDLSPDDPPPAIRRARCSPTRTCLPMRSPRSVCFRSVRSSASSRSCRCRTCSSRPAA